MNNQPLVSVGIPTYNRPEGLRRTLQCITKQTYKNLEIIVSDNCSSTDKTICIINEFIKKDKRIVFFRQAVNIGASGNFNFVLSQATGEFFKWLADDDWIDLNYIECCINFLTINNDYIAAYGCAKIYNNNDEYVLEDAKISLEQPDATLRVKFFFNTILYNGTFYGVIRKDNLQILKLTNKLADDWLIVARIAFKGKIKLLENTNCYLTQGGASQSFENLIKTLGLPTYIKHIPYLTVCVNIFKEILWDSKVYNELNYLKKLELSLRCSIIIWRRYNVWGELKKVFRKVLRKIVRTPVRGFSLLIKKTGLKDQVSHEKVFTRIYQNNIWGNDGKSKFYSGSGSDFRYSKSYIQLIREYINEYHIKTIVDLGCGDFRIGKEVIKNLDINYIGVDVVKSLIDLNNEKFSKPGISFTKLNITRKSLPDGDLCLIRQVLQHLSNKDIQSVLKNTRKYKHLIITEHLPMKLESAVNLDKYTDGDIRYSKGSGVYLDHPPFNLRIQELLRVAPEEHPNSIIVTYKIL